jgi:F420-0:gamma-glutamyl ligase-like protein
MEAFIIKYWLEVIFGAILGLIGLGYKKIKKKQEEQEKMQEEQERKNQAIENGVTVTHIFC